jgi:protocatechuate 3,4-dioxygenase beta subunit
MSSKAKEGGATRREFAIGAFGTVGGLALLAACDSDAPAGTALDAAGGGPAPTPGGPDAGVDASAPTGPADAGGPGTCTLYPRQTEGPFYLDLDNLRSDIKDGKAGVPLKIVVKVLSSAACAVLKDVAVDLWHADAEGLYSGYTRQGDSGNIDTTGQKFLRGTQITDANGQVSFETIYPGWYHGRTTHIHFKVHVSSSREATSQMYFPEDISQAVYATSAYAARGQKDTSNDQDRIALGGSGELPPLLTISGNAASGYTGTLTITVST